MRKLLLLTLLLFSFLATYGQMLEVTLEGGEKKLLNCKHFIYAFNSSDGITEIVIKRPGVDMPVRWRITESLGVLYTANNGGMLFVTDRRTNKPMLIGYGSIEVIQKASLTSDYADVIVTQPVGRLQLSDKYSDIVPLVPTCAQAGGAGGTTTVAEGDGIDVTGDPTSGYIISLEPQAVDSSGTYGSATGVPVVTVNEFGQITMITEVQVANIYNSDGSLSGPRTITSAGNNMVWDMATANSDWVSTTGDFSFSADDNTNDTDYSISSTGHTFTSAAGTSSSSVIMTSTEVTNTLVDGTNSSVVRQQDDEIRGYITDGSNAATSILNSTGLELIFSGTSDLKLNGDAGTSGYVLTSSGPGSAPTWMPIAATGTFMVKHEIQHNLTGNQVTATVSLSGDAEKNLIFLNGIKQYDSAANGVAGSYSVSGQVITFVGSPMNGNDHVEIYVLP